MQTKHNYHTCKEWNEKFQSPMELLKHVAKHSVHETDEVKDLKDQGEEVIQIEENQEEVRIEDLDEVKRFIWTKNKETTENEEKYKSFVFCESQFFWWISLRKCFK